MTNFNPQSLSNVDQDRLRRYKENLDFYNGTQWTRTTKERQLVFNYAKVAIDKVTSYLYQGFNFACDTLFAAPSAGADSGETGTTDREAGEIARRAEMVLREVYEANNLGQLDYETELDTAILGDGCYKVLWDTKEKRVKITAPDVTGIFAWWWGDDLSRVWRVASKYTLGQDEVRMAYGVKLTKKQVTIVEVWTQDSFELYIDNALYEKKANPYGFIPFVIFPNVRQPKQFWGLSDIPPLMESQRELNRALSQLSRILELSGNPIAVLENIESAEEIKVQPGAVWTIPEDAKAYLLDLLQGGGVRLHVDFIDLVYRCLHDLSEAPRAVYGGIERELSGVALEVEMHSLLQKVNRKRAIRTSVYKRRNEMIIALIEKFTPGVIARNEALSRAERGNPAGRSVNKLIRHRIVWGAVLPQDRARQAQNEQLLVQAGVHSRRRAMDELGIEDPDSEFERWMEERRRILKMNLEYRARSTRGVERERAFIAETEQALPEITE